MQDWIQLTTTTGYFFSEQVSASSGQTTSIDSHRGMTLVVGRTTPLTAPWRLSQTSDYTSTGTTSATQVSLLWNLYEVAPETPNAVESVFLCILIDTQARSSCAGVLLGTSKTRLRYFKLVRTFLNNLDYVRKFRKIFRKD